MTLPQAGIFALGTRAHHHLEFDLTGQATSVPGIVQRIREAATSVAGVNVVVGYGPRLWAKIAPDEVPDGIEDFVAIEGVDDFAYPASQHDVWLWLHGGSADVVLDMARTATSELAGTAGLAAKQVGFVYRASQDLTGFEDGTENPPLDEAMQIATIDAGRPCAGGSVALLQRWVHHLDDFDVLSNDDKDQVIGRTLAGSIELADDVRSPRAHISRVVIEDDDGNELEVWRRSVAFGNVGEHGLMFLAFSADQRRLHTMLERMAGIGDGIRDRLTDFSTPTASAWYVVPPIGLP